MRCPKSAIAEGCCLLRGRLNFARIASISRIKTIPQPGWKTDQTDPGLLNCKLNLSLRYADCVSFLTVGGMMRSILVAVLCAALAACTGADSYAFYPAFMRDAQPEPPAPEKPPRSGRLFANNLMQSLRRVRFLAMSRPPRRTAIRARSIGSLA